MFYTSTNSTTQALCSKRLNKKFDLASLPRIDPYLISIARLASRLIDKVEDAFTSIINAPSNDGREVTVLRWFRGARNCLELFDGERVEIDGADNILVMDTHDKLEQFIREWWLKHFRICLYRHEVWNSKEKMEPNAPIEIKDALRAFALTDERREPLRDTLALSCRGFARLAAN
jgi:hypothetical protein